ncbi:MAG: iron ABC transporter permease [Trueperella sp.]|nr:iron ABC transporter permease [Trueperella sp.]
MRNRLHLSIALAALIPASFLILFFVWPVGAMLWRGISDPAGGLLEVLTLPRTWNITRQTIGMAVAATAGSLLLGIPGAFALYRLRFPGRNILRAIATMPFVLPTVVTGVAFRALLDAKGSLGFLGLDQTVTAVVIAMVFFNYGVVVRTVGNLWASLDPQDEAARTLGATPFQAFYTVTLPQLGPGIAAAGGLVFLFCSTSFGLVQTLGRPGYGTLESEIYVQTTAYLDLATAAGLSAIQFAIVIAALLVSNLLSKRTDATLRVRDNVSRPARRRDLPIITGTVAVIAVLILAPLSALVLGSLRAGGEWSLHNYQVLARTGAGFSGGTSVLQALEHSLRIALDAAVVSVIVGVLVALLLSRRPQTARWIRAQQLLDGFVLLPLGVSAVTVGFGFLITWGRLPNFNAALLVPLAQAVVALPLVVRSLVPVLRAIDPRMREAAATLGASPARILATIDLPLLVRGLGLAFGFAFAISIGEFGATSFLASPDYQTLPVLIGKLLGRPGVDNYGMALAGGVILALLSGGVMTLADLLRPRSVTKGIS